jgi:hypothetical protein
LDFELWRRGLNFIIYNIRDMIVEDIFNVDFCGDETLQMIRYNYLNTTDEEEADEEPKQKTKRRRWFDFLWFF